MRFIALVLVLALVGGQGTTHLPLRVVLDAPVGTPDTFYLAAESAELSGTTNGSTVTPTTNHGPSGVLHITGTGEVNFASMVSGNGVQFLQGNQQATNSAWMAFSGATLANIWNTDLGEYSFYIKSSLSWADRQLLATPQRIVFQVYDDVSTEVASFTVTVFPGSPNRLKFRWGATSYAGVDYDIANGDEDTVYGLGVTVKIRVTWDCTNRATDAGRESLYINDVLAVGSPIGFTCSDPTWGSDSIMVVGAQSGNVFPGFFSFDDRLDEFHIKGGA